MAFSRKLFCLQSAFLLISFLLLSLPIAHAFTADPPAARNSAAEKKKEAPPPDKIIFTNGDQLSGTLLREVGGTVTFHSDVVGDISVPWAKIRELQTKTQMAVLEQSVSPHHNKIPAHLPEGTLSIADNLITVHPDNRALIPPIPVKKAQYIIDRSTLDKQILGHPGFFGGWNGSTTAGATIVQATQNQYTFNGAVTLVRDVPTVSWLDTRNRTTIDFTGSYGKITQPAYVSEGVFYPETDTKSSIYHASGERDEYFSARGYVLAQTAFDHNYSQGLNLQQIYGGGVGHTAIKRPKQQLDVTATIQYEKQTFINATDGVNQNLIGSTLAGTYLLKLPHGLIFKQLASYIPAYNNPNAYSASETETLAIPFYKSLSFSIGTLDSYLNNPPPAVPQTMRNSFQFTFGATYIFKSKY